MTVTEFLAAIAQLSGVLFVVTSMLAMGLSLTIPMIVQPQSWSARKTFPVQTQSRLSLWRP